MTSNSLDPIENDKRILAEWQEIRRRGRGRHIAKSAFLWAVGFSIGPAMVAFFRNDMTKALVYSAFSGPLAVAAGVFFGIVSWKEQERKYDKLIRKHGLPDENN
ncbi:MAG: hypothetical protein H8E37_04265 [Planctomycetes bacterium]|nr:hypothetical protein [Planctomycetota bacterium]